MINRWLDKGVDGFRMDVITCLAKDPMLPDGTGRPYAFSPEHFAMQPRLHEHLREMRKACFADRDCMCVGEATFATAENAASLVGGGQELDMIFQFDLMDVDGGESKWDLRAFDLIKFKEIVARWQKTLDWNTLFWGNHDQPRAVSRFGCTEQQVPCRGYVSAPRYAVYLSGRGAGDDELPVRKRGAAARRGKSQPAAPEHG